MKMNARYIEVIKSERHQINVLNPCQTGGCIGPNSSSTPTCRLKLALAVVRLVAQSSETLTDAWYLEFVLNALSIASRVVSYFYRLFDN